MAGLRALIVDDEPVARRVLREELESIGGVEVVGEAENGEAALKEVSAKQPDVVFLDIQMPVMGGFEMLKHLSDGFMPVVVMVTAYDRHAIRAFEEGAIDYLLKPVSQERLKQAVGRAVRMRRDRISVAENIASLQEIAPPAATGELRTRKIVGKIGDEFFLLNPQEILAFHAEGELVWIIGAKRRYQATLSLRAIEQRLRDSSFSRIHRNALVNVNQIQKMSMLSSQRWLVTLNNGQEFVVSKRQAANVRNVLNW